MSTEQNKSVVRAIFEEILNQGDSGSAGRLVGAGYVNHKFPLPQPGPEGFLQMLEMFRTGFPDMRVELDEVIGEGDLVSTRGSFVGTHRGEFMGVPASGSGVKVAYIDLWRIEDGKAVENWVELDLPGLMQQIGAAPSPAAATG